MKPSLKPPFLSKLFDSNGPTKLDTELEENSKRSLTQSCHFYNAHYKKDKGNSRSSASYSFVAKISHHLDLFSFYYSRPFRRGFRSSSRFGLIFQTKWVWCSLRLWRLVDSSGRPPSFFHGRALPVHPDLLAKSRKLFSSFPHLHV